MTLYLVRHSKAQVSHPLGDLYRTLTEEGLQRVESVTRKIAQGEWNPGIRLSSPYPRAVETAQRFGHHLDFGSHSLETSNLFTPDGDPRDALIKLQNVYNEGHEVVWVFTHNPFVTDLARFLLNPEQNLSINFQTPTVYGLHFLEGPEKGKAEILWAVHSSERD